MYIDLRNLANKCVVAAKRQYFANKIDSITFSTKQLFKVSNDLLKKSQSSVLTTNIPPSELSERFGDFSDKIKILRDKLDSRQCPSS